MPSHYRNSMKSERIDRFSCSITILGVLQFFLLTFLAAFFYPGGYDYFGYFFSDLGAVTARNGTANTTSSFIFLITLILVAVFMIPTWLILPTLFKESIYEKITSYIGSIVGLLVSPLLIGTAIYPMDTEPVLHGDFARYMFLAFGTAILIYSIAILLNKDYSNYYSIVGFIIFVLVLIYVFIGLGDLQTFLQKVIVYSYILWAFIQVFRIWPSVEPS